MYNLVELKLCRVKHMQSHIRRIMTVPVIWVDNVSNPLRKQTLYIRQCVDVLGIYHVCDS